MYEYSLVEPRQDLDEFLTPPKLVENMVIITRQYFDQNAPIKILDPGANIGQFGVACRNVYPNSHIIGAEIMSIDKPSCYDVWFGGQDFIRAEVPGGLNLVIGNPPYSKPRKGIAEEFVRKSLSLLVPGGMLFFLLRTNFGNAKTRSRGLFKEFPLYRKYFVDRPSFYEHDPRTKHYGKKKSNMHDYSIYVWQKGFTGVPTLHWLTWEDDNDKLLCESVL